MFWVPPAYHGKDQPTGGRDQQHLRQRLPAKPCAGGGKQFGIAKPKPLGPGFAEIGLADQCQAQIAGRRADQVVQKGGWGQQCRPQQPRSDQRQRQRIGDAQGGGINAGDGDKGTRQQGGGQQGKGRGMRKQDVHGIVRAFSSIRMSRGDPG